MLINTDKSQSSDIQKNRDKEIDQNASREIPTAGKLAPGAPPTSSPCGLAAGDSAPWPRAASDPKWPLERLSYERKCIEGNTLSSPVACRCCAPTCYPF
jgi:hypothetical protein